MVDNPKEKKTDDYGDPLVFPRWTNRVPVVIAAGLLLVFAAIVFVFWYWFSPKNFNVGYQPEQPIPYSHQLHVGELGLDCRYCHTTVDKGPAAAIPPTETCMNCHKIIKKDSEAIKKITESYETNRPIEWIQIHRLPGYAYFNHSQHVNAGVSCVSCHGRVDQMKRVRQVEPLSMGWCLDCHRHPEKHLRPVDQVTNMTWKSEDQIKTGLELMRQHNIHPKEDCSTCHR